MGDSSSSNGSTLPLTEFHLTTEISHEGGTEDQRLETAIEKARRREQLEQRYNLVYISRLALNSRYRLIEVVGSGGFGSVIAGFIRGREDDNKIALKSCFKTDSESDNYYLYQKIHSEIDALCKVRSLSNCVTFRWAFQTANAFCIETDYCPSNIDLFDYISEYMPDERLPLDRARVIFKQAAQAVLDVRSKGILHGDLKEENFLVNRHTLKVTLIDFGGAKEYDNTKKYSNLDGTRPYFPPEYLRFNQVTASALNSWSLGVTFYSALCGRLPFGGANEVICGKLDFEIPLTILARHLITKLLMKNPAERMSLTSVVTHEFFYEKDITAQIDTNAPAQIIGQEKIRRKIRRYSF